MKYLEFKPDQSLSKYIQLIWIAASESPDDFYPREKVLPDGIVEIIFHFADPFITYNIGGTKTRQPNGFAISQMKKYIEIESDGEIGFVSVRFYPWGAHHFFDTPVSSFLDGYLEIEKLWPNHSRKILQDIKHVGNDNKQAIVQSFLKNQLKNHKKQTQDIDLAVKLIRESKGNYTIEKLCQNLDIHYKHLERRFLSTIGTTPKVFSRTTRFLHLCQNLKEYENLTMAQLAHDLGYFDQSHFTKDFKAFSGMTPKEYYKQTNICFTEL